MGKRDNQKYSDDRKAAWRRRIWNAIEALLPGKRWLRNVAYLETAEGHETQYLISKGYNPERLFAVNFNAAEMATLTRRFGRIVNTVGVDLLAASRRIPPIDILNFDGTRNISTSSMTYLQSVAAHLNPKVIAINVLAGRERADDAYRRFGQIMGHTECRDGLTAHADLDDKHLPRIRSLSLALTTCPRDLFPDSRRPEIATSFIGGDSELEQCCLSHLLDFRAGSYLSGAGQPMVWLAARRLAHESGLFPDSRRARKFFGAGMYFASCDPRKQLATMKR